MLSETTKAAIVVSAPKTVTFQGTAYTAVMEYADRKEVDEVLTEGDIAVMIRYYGDRKDREATPSNLLMGVDTSGTDIAYSIGEKRQVTLSINVYIPRGDKVPAADVIDAYMTAVQLWVINELADLVDIADVGDVSDLTHLENGLERRQVDITIRYQQGYTQTVGTIDTIQHDLTTL